MLSSVLVAVIPIVIAIFGGFYLQQRAEARRQRIDRYVKFVRELRALYVKYAGDTPKKEELLAQYAELWACSSDSVLRAAKELFDGIRKGGGGHEVRMQELVLRIRREVQCRTKSKREDFLILAP